MGRQTTLSILGLYNYDNTIFDNMYVPTGIDKDLLVSNILLECAELEVLLPEPTIMKQAITFWSNAMASVWDKMQASTEFVYNPIWNKDGVITESRDITTTRNLGHSSDYTDTHNLTHDRDYDSTQSRAAYNASAFQNTEKVVDNDTLKDTGTLRTAGSDSDTGTIRDAGTISRTEQGNIGITSTQQLIKEEREVSEFSMYNYLVEAFKKRFCLLVY